MVRVAGIALGGIAEDAGGHLARGRQSQGAGHEVHVALLVARQRLAEQRLLVAEGRMQRRSFHAGGVAVYPCADGVLVSRRALSMAASRSVTR